MINSYQNTTAGRTSALAEAKSDQARLWYDGDTIHVLPVQSVPVPQEITRAQAKIALSRVGKLVTAKEAVAQIGGEAQLWWDEALTFSRANKWVLSLGPVIGLTPAQLDDLFIAAAGIE